MAVEATAEKDGAATVKQSPGLLCHTKMARLEPALAHTTIVTVITYTAHAVGAYEIGNVRLFDDDAGQFLSIVTQKYCVQVVPNVRHNP
jgi:hypothetical protein